MIGKMKAVVCGTAFGRFYLCALAQSQSTWILVVTRSWLQISTLIGSPTLIEPDTPPEVALCQQLSQQEVE